MQLEQILSAAVAAGAVNELDDDGLPSPGIPQASPNAPISATGTSLQSTLKVINFDPDEYERAEYPSTIGTNMSEAGGDDDDDHIRCSTLESDHMSLFNFGEDNLIITSQQALAMFENSDDGCVLESSKKPPQRVDIRISRDNTAFETPTEDAQCQKLNALKDIINEGGDVPAACGEIEIETSEDISTSESLTEIKPVDSVDAKQIEGASEANLLDCAKPFGSEGSSLPILDNDCSTIEGISTSQISISELHNDSFSSSLEYSNRTEIEKFVEDAVSYSYKDDFIPEEDNISRKICHKDEFVGSTTAVDTADASPNDGLVDTRQYASLTPVCCTTDQQATVNDNLVSLNEIDPPATIDATLDENGQFLVQVFAPGLSMTIPNQFMNKPSEESDQTTSTNVLEYAQPVEQSDQNTNENVTSQHNSLTNVKNNTAITRNPKRSRSSSPGKSKLDKILKTLSSKQNLVQTPMEKSKTDLDDKLKMKLKRKRRRKEKYDLNYCSVSQISNSQFFDHMQSPQFAKYFHCDNMMPPPSNCCHPYHPPENVFTSGNNTMPMPSNHYPYHRPYQSQLNEPYYNDDLNNWSLEEMLGPSNSSFPVNGDGPPQFHQGNNRFTSYSNSDLYVHNQNYQSRQNISMDLEENDEELPIIMSPEEYHEKMKNCEPGQLTHESAELVKNTDGDSLKVQLVYLVYPCNKNQKGKKNERRLCQNTAIAPSTMPSSSATQSDYHQPPYDRNERETECLKSDMAEPSARNKTVSWLQNDCVNTRKVDSYRTQPMSVWSSRDVAHFLIEATHDLGISYENTDFLRLGHVAGANLATMTPTDFNKIAPGEGQRLFDYVRRHKNHEILSSEDALRPIADNYSMPSLNTPPPISTCEAPPLTAEFNLESNMSYEHFQTNNPPSNFIEHNSYSSEAAHNIPQNNLHALPYEPPQIPYHTTSDMYSLHSSHMPPPVSNYPPDPYVGTINCQTSAAGRTVDVEYHVSSGYGSDMYNYVPQNHELDFQSPPSTYSNISDPDDSSDEEGDSDEEDEEDLKCEQTPPPPPKKRGPGRPPKPENERKKKKKRTGRLWEFIRNLLLNPQTCPSIVKWEDAEAGVFRFVNSEKVAEYWGMRKNNRKMNYEKLSRAMRYYYKGKVFEPVLGRRLVYKFGVNAKGWKPNYANFGR